MQLRGSNQYPIFPRLTQGKSWIDFETNLVDNSLVTAVLDPLINYLVTDNVIDKWNATQVENYQDLIGYGVQLLVELKNQWTQINLCPRLTRSSSTAGSTFTRADLVTLEISLAQEIQIPPVCYAIAELYTAVLQLQPAAYFNGFEARYFMPFRPHKTLTEIETLLSTISALYAAQVFATQAKAPLVPVNLDWVHTIIEVPYESWYGNMLAKFWPCNYDNGGAETESFAEIDETTAFNYQLSLGVPEYLDAAVLFRSHSCADDPAFITVESIANDKINLLVGNINSTALTEVDKTTSNYKWLLNVTAAQSGVFYGMFGAPSTTTYAYPFKAYQTAIRPSPDSWNILLSLWLKRHFNGAVVHKTMYDIGNDLIMSAMRRSGGGLRADPERPGYVIDEFGNAVVSPSNWNPESDYRRPSPTGR
jgi:hypothetical protein